MASIKYSDLLKEVLPGLSADPSDPVTENAIKRAVIELCARSWIWKMLCDQADVTAGESVVDMEPEMGASVAAVVSVEYNGKPIEPADISRLDASRPGWRMTTGEPVAFTQIDAGQIILTPTPDATQRGALSITLALQPSLTATGFPKWIAEKYLESIADGALARLLLMPGKPWADGTSGQLARSRFDQAIATARSSAASSIGRAALRVTSQH